LPTGALPQGGHVGGPSAGTTPGALPQGRHVGSASVDNPPPGAQAVLDGGDPMHTVLGVGAAGPGPSVFSQYGGEPLPEDFSLSKFADFKRWFAMYRSSILFGGAAGIAAVIILVILMRACGSAPGPAARSDVPPPDAAEVKRVDAAEAPPARDADPHVHAKQASGSAAH
jgi:hypothetical protein